MNIVHLTSVHKHNDTRIFIKECSSLVSAGYSVYFISPDSPEDTINNVKLCSVRKQGKSRLTRMTKGVWEVYKKARTINAFVYHFHDPELIPVGLLLKLSGKKVIYDIHEDVPRQVMSKYWIPKYLRNIISVLFERFEDFTVRYFDAVISATPFIQNRFRKLSNSVNVNNYPIVSELSVPIESENMRRTGIVYVGGITKIRGIIEMIKSVETVDTKLMLAGKFSSENLRQEAIKTPGWDKVEEMGFLDRDGLARILSKAIAGLVLFHPEPNHINAQPNKMFEYMSAGIPVIASDFPLWREIVEGANCGICVNPLDPIEIQTAINWLIQHPEEAITMGKNGQKAIEEKFNWNEESKKLMKLYKDLKSR